MPKAVWNGRVIAESDKTQIVEGNHYFPPESLKKEFFRPHERRTRCSWKGEANYYTLTDGARTAQAAAWYYPEPLAKALHIKNYVAFGKEAEIQD